MHGDIVRAMTGQNALIAFRSTLHKHVDGSSHEPLILSESVLLNKVDQGVEPALYNLVRRIVLHRSGRRTLTSRVDKREDLRIPYAFDQVIGRLEILFGFPGKAHDDVGRKRDVGIDLANLFDKSEIASRRCSDGSWP